MNKRKYHYEYVVYTDNLYYGRMLIGRAGTSRSYAHYLGASAGKGCFIVKKERVYDNN